MLSNYWLLPLRWQPNWLFESLTAFNFGWKDDDDDDDAVRLPFPYPWVAHFDHVNNRLFLWTWLFRFFHYIFYLAIWWGPFKLGLLNLWLFFTCATLKWKTGPENVLGFLSDWNASSNQTTNLVQGWLNDTYILIFLSLEDRLLLTIFWISMCAWAFSVPLSGL